MSALRQPDFDPKSYSQGILPQQAGDPEGYGSRNRNRQINQQARAKSAKVVRSKSFSSRTTLPSNLKSLSLLQKGSFGLAIASMSVSIGLYMSTVQIPKLWSQEYQQLENLQRQERQLIAINETIKYQTAKEAAQDDRLSVSEPESAIFLTPAKVEQKNLSNTQKNDFETDELKHSGYGY